MNKSYSNLDNARFDDQKEIMERLEQKGLCPFCEENMNDTEVLPALRDASHWHITNNRWPYKSAHVHLLLISKMHCEDLNDLTSEAWSELLHLIQWAEKEYQIHSGGLGMRFGDVKYNGGTVQHLHVHLFVPKEKGDDYEPIRFKIG